MTQLWFLPIAALVGFSGTQLAIKSMKLNRKDRSWWLLVVLGWFPLACWILSQVVRQG